MQQVYCFINKIRKISAMSIQESQKVHGIRKNSKETTTNQSNLAQFDPVFTDQARLQDLGKSPLTSIARQPAGQAPLIKEPAAMNVESQVVSDSSRQRLATQDLIPSFRQRYEIYELLQEVSDSKRKLELKNKQIFYLSNQLVSVKDEYSQRVLQLEAVIAENKRELTELRYAGLKNKRMESERGDRVLEESKKNYELQIHNMKQVQDEVIKKLHLQHKQQKDNMEEKFISLLNLEKRDKASLQEVHQQKCTNYQALIKELQEEIKRLYQHRESDAEVTRQHQIAVEIVKKQFVDFSIQATQLEKNLRIEIRGLGSQVAALEQQISTLKKEKLALSQQSSLQISQLSQQNELHKQQITKFRQLVGAKDKEIEKLIQASLKAERRKENSVDPVRVCNHEGLIRQLERNIDIKCKENTELRDQLNEWGKYIGFDRPCQDRTIDLLNASSEALQTQQSFASSLRKKVGRFS